MKTRRETARFIENQLITERHYECKREKKTRHHYGWQELRELMDFIYEGEPKGATERLVNTSVYKNDNY